MPHFRKAWRVVLGAGALAACSSTESKVPSTLVVTPSPVTLTAKGRTAQLHAAVLDQNGDTLKNRTLVWSSDHVQVATVDTAGKITATGGGSATITVSSGGINGTASVTVTQVAASDSVAGDNQIGMASVTLGYPVVVVIEDSAGHRAKGDTVHFSVTGGGGLLSSATAISNDTGYAMATWTLGPGGAQTVHASASNGFTWDYAAHLYSPPASLPGFQVAVVNVGPAFTPKVQAAFDSAAAFWGRVITSDDSDATLSTGDQDCGVGFPAIGPVNVDDIMVMALVHPMDGPGGILGGATPCFVRATQAGVIVNTLMGVAEFDSDDFATLSDSNVIEVIKHEMGHVLGFGTYWFSAGGGFTAFGCLQSPTTGSAAHDTFYNCEHARAQFDSIGGTSYTGGSKVPLENCVGQSNCGQGTYNSHWREAVFGNELMTGFLNSGVNPASSVTVAAMQDLGYTVDKTKAESYSHVFSTQSAFQLVPAHLRAYGNDAHGPVFAITPSGRRRIGPRPAPFTWVTAR